MSSMNYLLEQEENLITYFILPLIGINKSIFGRKFKQTYLSKEGDFVYVRVTSLVDGPLPTTHENFVAIVEVRKEKMYMYKYGDRYAKDIDLIKQGLYSRISKEAKKIIYLNSTLPYNSVMSDFKVTHPILHALSRTKKLRVFLKDALGVTELSTNGELLGKFPDEWYV